MESLSQNSLADFPPDILTTIRKFWGLDKPGQMKEAVIILDEWVKKQPHFLMTEFDPEFLETTIIAAKGSIERAKAKLDKYCTLKTLMPKYFEKFDYNAVMKEYRSVMDMVIIPKFTPEYHRVIMVKFQEVFDSHALTNMFKHDIVALEYQRRHDYCNGIVTVLDFRSVDLVQFMRNMDIMELRDVLTILIEGYGVRVGGIHFITESKVIETLVNILKQVMKSNLTNRIKVHKNEQSLYKYIDKDILPAEYGGKEKSLKELHDAMTKAVGSKEHIEYMDRMRKYGTDETLRPKNQFHESYMGMPGTFRMLSVD